MINALATLPGIVAVAIAGSATAVAETRPPSPAYLGLPANASVTPGILPSRLSETGLFTDMQRMAHRAALVPYEVNVPFWSDGAQKLRWIAVPDDTHIGFSPRGSWTFPNGTVFVKTFEIGTDERRPQQRRRLETRLLVRDDRGGVYGAVYKWRSDNSDADLLTGALTEPVSIRTAKGYRIQQWYYPSREDCLTCHTTLAGGVLGVNTRQLNGKAENAATNQLVRWNRLGLFKEPLDESSLAPLPALARADDNTRSLADRARSYLDVNCAHCHLPGGTVASFDARFETPPEHQQLIDGPVLIDQGIDHARILAPHDRWRSILLMRANTLEDFRMPPIGRNQIDESGMELLVQWIDSLPGKDVAPPPEIAPRGGNFNAPVIVTISASPGAIVRYTLDGSAPGAEDALYKQPIKLSEPTIVRARAFAAGTTDSIVSQQIFIIGQ